MTENQLSGSPAHISYPGTPHIMDLGPLHMSEIGDAPCAVELQATPYIMLFKTHHLP